MLYYSTNHLSPKVNLKQAIMHTEAADGGLYMPEKLPSLPRAFINNFHGMSPSDLSYVVMSTLIDNEIPGARLKQMCDDCAFKMPIYEIEPGIYVMELFHGPTLSVKDYGARMLALLIQHLHCGDNSQINVLIPTTGNSGNAIANVFHNVPGVNVITLCPRSVHRSHFAQLYSYGDNIHAIEVNGHLEHCSMLAQMAFHDDELSSLNLTSANSLNIGCVLPYISVFFSALAQLSHFESSPDNVFLSVPAGSCGNLLGAYMAKKMGLPLAGIIAGCNEGSGLPKYLERGIECTHEAPAHHLAQTLNTTRSANFPRILDLAGGDLDALRREMIAQACTDTEIADAINSVYARTGYLLDPASAVGYISLKNNMPSGAKGIFFATQHPSRSYDILEKINYGELKLPPHIKRNYCVRPEATIPPTYAALRKYIKSSSALSGLMQHRG